MRYSLTWLVLTASVAGLLAGCSAPACPTQPTIARITAETPEAYDRLWEATGDALRQHYFRLDRQDRVEGIISTFPETSAQLFELWRPQPEPLYYAAESNLHTIALEAKATITPVEGQGAYELVVQVDRVRYGLDERQIDNSAGALRLYSSEAPTASGRMERPSESANTVPLGRDKPAEERLLNSILAKYVKAVTAAASCADQAAATSQPQ